MDITSFITSLIGAGLGTACVNYAFNRRIKAIEKENLWQTKLLDDVYNAHKSLWEDVREYTIPFYFSYHKEDEDTVSTYIMYFLRSADETNKLIINFRDNLSKYSVFLEKSISNDAEYIQLYMDDFQKLLAINSLNIEKSEKEIRYYEWILIADEFSKIFEKDALPVIRELQTKTENFLRKNILEHEWIEITDKERQKKAKAVKTKLEKTQLHSKINKEILFIK